MATGDANDILSRVKALLPKLWFSQPAPLRDSLIGGISDSAAWCYAWITYARLQVRLRSATGLWLDIASRDYLGVAMPRRPNENDASFASRLIKDILRPRNTRAAILQVLFDLTGNSATIQEPWNPYDWGGYGISQSGYGNGLGYGSLQYNNQVFVKAVRPNGAGIPNVAGYGTVASGYGTIAPAPSLPRGGSGMYADLSQVVGPVTDAEIYANVARTVSAGITAWVDIVSAGNPATGSLAFNSPQTLAMEAAFGFYW